MTFSLPALGVFLRDYLTFTRQCEPAVVQGVEASAPAVGRAAVLDETEGVTRYGGDSDDLLRGWHGNDLLDGGKGDDTIYGGEGADAFVFGVNLGNDTI